MKQSYRLAIHNMGGGRLALATSFHMAGGNVMMTSQGLTSAPSPCTLHTFDTLAFPAQFDLQFCTSNGKPNCVVSRLMF